jgi:hypothetical protein
MGGRLEKAPDTTLQFDQIARAGKNSIMKARSDLTINGKKFRKGTKFPWYFIYPFFLVHMLAFGLSGFFMAYSSDAPELSFLYIHGGFAIFVYTIFYLAIFGVDEIKWMFINAALGLLGIYAQIDLILSLFDKQAGDFPPTVHVIPFLYYILYTFLLYQMILDVTGAREDPRRKKIVEGFYITASVLVYGGLFLVNR